MSLESTRVLLRLARAVAGGTGIRLSADDVRWYKVADSAFDTLMENIIEGHGDYEPDPTCQKLRHGSANPPGADGQGGES